MKKIFFLGLIFLAFHVYAVVEISLPPDGNLLDLGESGGRLFLPMEIIFLDGTTKYGAFFVDTGASCSVFFNRNKIPSAGLSVSGQDEELIEPPLRIQSATSGNLKIKSWTLIQRYFNVPAEVNYQNKSIKVLGIVGTDILFQKSFYLSIVHKKMGWYTYAPFEITESFEIYPMVFQDEYSHRDQYTLTLIIPCDYRFSGHNQSRNGGKDGYLIDTGCFQIGAGFDAFSQRLDQIPNSSLTYQDETSPGITHGTVIIPYYALGGVNFKNIYFSGGSVDSHIKVLGTQILSRFDWWFEITRDYIPKSGKLYKGRAYANMVDESDYNSFIQNVDLREAFIYDPTIGFDTDNNNLVCKIFFTAGVAIHPEISIGDTVISFNGKEFKDDKIKQLPEGRYGLKNSTGKIYFIDAKNVHLERKVVSED